MKEEERDRHADYVQLNEDNVYQWNLALMVLNPGSLYYGGYFKAQMTFPKDYPYRPPGELSRGMVGANILTECRLSLHQASMASQHLS